MSAAQGDWLGEYLGLAVDANTAYLGFVRRGDPEGDVYFDSILNSQIPEPSSFLLATVGLVCLLGCDWRTRL